MKILKSTEVVEFKNMHIRANEIKQGAKQTDRLKYNSIDLKRALGRKFSTKNKQTFSKRKIRKAIFFLLDVLQSFTEN